MLTSIIDQGTKYQENTAFIVGKEFIIDGASCIILTPQCANAAGAMIGFTSTEEGQFLNRTSSNTTGRRYSEL